MWPRYREQGKLLPQRKYIWDIETKGLINSDGKTSKNKTNKPKKQQKTTKKRKHQEILLYMPRNFSSHLQFYGHHILRRKMLQLVTTAKGSSLGFRHTGVQRKSHKAIKGPIWKGNNENAKYTLFPWVISKSQQAMLEVGYLKKESNWK